jgi:hypothetical protein
VSARRREIGLRGRRSGSLQGEPHGQFQATRQLPGLIEATRPLPPPVQWNGHEQISAIERVRACPAHERGERHRDRPPAAVLQRVNDRAQ